MRHRLPRPVVSTRAVWIVLVTAALLSGPLTRKAFAQATVTVNPTRVVAGQTVNVSGTGWAPNDQILVSFTDPAGNILPLGVITADASGNFSQSVAVPATVPAGTYQIDGNGRGGSVAVNITIVAPTATLAPATATSLPASTPVPTLGAVAPSAVSESPTATQGSSATPTEPPTPTPTEPPTATSTPTSTLTSTVTSTSTPTTTSTPTSTSTSTSTSTPTPANTPTFPERVVTAGQGTGPIGWIGLILLGALAGYAVGRRR